MRSNIVSAEAQDMFLTKRTLALLQKDDFEVCTRQLRNGVKFYQDKEMIEAFSKNPIATVSHVTVMDAPLKKEAAKPKERVSKQPQKAMNPTKTIAKK